MRIGGTAFLKLRPDCFCSPVNGCNQRPTQKTLFRKLSSSSGVATTTSITAGCSIRPFVPSRCLASPTSGGLVNPAAEVGRIAREAGVLFLLDATQSVGQFPVDVETIGCDLLTATGRKFLRGPRGTGFLWVRPDALERLDPFVAEIRSATWNGRRGFDWVDGARRFESWENSYVNLLGLRGAVRQALELGLEAIAERTLALGTELRARLDELPGVSTYDLGEVRCAIVTARVADVASADVASALSRAGVNVTVTVPEHTQFDTEDRGLPPLVRLSPHYYNTEAEVDEVAAAVAELAR